MFLFNINKNKELITNFFAKQSTLQKGSGTDEKIRKFIRERGLEKDVAGHIIGKLFGGPGNAEFNIVGMDKTFNNSPYKQFELETRDWLKKELALYHPEKDIEMEITVEPRYQSTNESFHPNEYKYSVDFSVDGTNGHNRACILKCLCSNCK